MNKLKLTLIGLALVFVSTFTNAISVSGNAAIQTDYIWRGMTQNGGENSVNVGLDVDSYVDLNAHLNVSLDLWKRGIYE